MQNVAQAWLMYRLTQSSFMLGLVSFLSLAPILLLGMAGGLIADRFSRRHLLITAQILGMTQALTLAFLTLSGLIEPWEIAALALFLGIVQALEMPARHAGFAEWVPREDLPNAIALNSTLFNTARFLGPLLAGWIVVLAGEGTVFLLNGISFLAAAIGLMGIHAPASRLPSAADPATVREGLRYAWRHVPIRAALLMIAALSLLATPYLTLMPLFAREIFAGGAETLGILMGAVGAGALIGALRLAQRRASAGLERTIGFAATSGGIGLCIFPWTQTLSITLPILAIIGFSLATVVVSCNTYIQTQLPDRLRGRIMALFFVSFMGFSPFGSLAAGALAELIGAPITVTCLGGLFLMGAAAFMRFAHTQR